MLKKMLNYLQLLRAYIVLNTKMQLEYRAAFFSQMGAMFFNDCVWVAFWCIFFDRFHSINGFGSKELVTLWAVSAGGFGLAHGFFGNGLRLASMIAQGELDTWMLFPRALLSHVLIGRLSPAALGDALFGYSAYILFVRPDCVHLLLFFVLTLSVAVLFIGFSVLTGSLSFFIGNAESTSEHWRFALITFSTYPADLFTGPERLLLFTLVPAVFVNEFPMQALQHLSLIHAAWALGGSVMIAALSVLVFYCGLRRYESGNLVSMQG